MSVNVIAERQKLDDWVVLSEVFYAPYYGVEPARPAVVVRQHAGTKEIRVDIFDCNHGLPVTSTNAGHDQKERAKWYRDVRVRTEYNPLRVRFLGSDLEVRT